MSCQGTLMGRGAHSDAPLISGYGEDESALLSDGSAVFDPSKPDAALAGSAKPRKRRLADGASADGALGMLSEAGGAVMGTLVTVAADLTEERELERSDVLEAVSEGLAQVAEVFPEATDEEVRGAVAEKLAPSFGARGWKPLDPHELYHTH